MKTRPLAFALLLSLTPAVTATPVFAQTTADDPTTKAARARFQEGVEFYDKGQYENARAAFLQAYALRKHPAVLINLAQSCLHSNHPLEAAHFFSQYLHDSGGLSDKQRGDAERGLAEARQKLGRIEVMAPVGVDVSLDGQSVGPAPFSEALDVEPGTHTVKARNEELRVSVAAGRTGTAKFNGEQAAAAPAVVAPVAPAGSEASSAEAPRETESEKPASKEEAASKPGLFSPPQTMAPVYVGGVITVAGFATAIVMLVAKSSAQNSANSVADEIRQHGGKQGTCSATDAATVATFGQACGALTKDDNAVNNDAKVGNIALTVGIVGAVFTAGWYLFASKGEDAPAKKTDPASEGAFRLAPMTGPHLAGLTFGGNF